MTGYLLDVNVLIALMDPLHIHHEAAHAWYASLEGTGWATCATTENSVVRILSNPAYPTADLSPREAISHVDRFLSQAPAHAHWPTTVSLRDERFFNRAFIQGHPQITDIFLAGVAHNMKGRLSTFDRSIPYQAVRGANADLICIIPA
jgi:toxin-antitoxin system PIN domain toxin